MAWAEGKKVKKSEGKHFFVACVMIVKWHVSSLGFVDARVWMVDISHMKNITDCS